MIMRKLWDLIKRTITRHEHEIAEMPSAMGAKVLRVCRAKGCKFMETVDATPEQRTMATPVAARVSDFQRGIVDAVERELKG
jgi:hypothetical protein